MEVVIAHGAKIMLEIEGCRHKFTVEQLAYIVRQAYWRLDQRSGAYLARIIADALIEPPVEAPPDAVARHISSGLCDFEKSLHRMIKQHNPPVGRESPPKQSEQAAETKEEQETPPETVEATE